MQTLTEVVQQEGKIYIYIENVELAERFMKQAEEEGFTFGDGAKPTERFPESVMAVNPDKTINYIGINGHIAWQCKPKTVNGKPFKQMNYRHMINDF